MTELRRPPFLYSSSYEYTNECHVCNEDVRCSLVTYKGQNDPQNQNDPQIGSMIGTLFSILKVKMDNIIVRPCLDLKKRPTRMGKHCTDMLSSLFL